MLPMPYYARMARRNPKPDLMTLNREARLLLGAALFGALAVPALIWITGRIMLGPYANGGMLAMFDDFFSQLFSGSLPAWIVLVAPYVLLSTLRLAALLFRRI
jgi:hypothetical protein